MATFAEFLTWPDREAIVILDLEPFLALTGWTAVGGGAPNTYQHAFASHIGQTRVLGGVYRPCVGLRENDTALTERSSLAAVDANAGSWWWDEANELLYAHSTTGSDPDTFTVYNARVRFHVGTTGLVLNATDGDGDTGVYYWPWITQDSRDQVEQEVADLFFGITETPVADLVLANGHGFWHTIVAPDGPYTWKNKRVRAYLGGRYRGQDLPRSEYAATMTMEVEDVAADEETCTFTLKPLARITEMTLPITPYFASDYPNLGEGVEGTRKWIGYGRTTLRPDLTDTSSHGVYTIADAAFQTLFAVHSVTAVNKSNGARTTLSLTTHYTVDLTACTVTIVDATYAHDDFEIEVDVTGKPDGAGDYLQTFGEIVQDVLTTLVGIDVADIDTAAFAQADLDAPEELAFWIKSPRALASILATSEEALPSLGRSVMGTVQQTRAGLWTCWIWDPGYDAATVISLTKEDFTAFRPQPTLESIFATTRLHFNRNHATGAWAIEQTSDTKVQYSAQTQDRLDLYTYLRSASDAQTLAQRYQLFSGSVTTEVEFEERGAKLAQARVGDRVLVTYDPAPAAAGAYTKTPFELLTLSEGYTPTLLIAGRLGNLRGVGVRVGRWTADSAPAWGAATDADKAQSGYWSDDDGLIDPADLSTKDLSIYI